MQTQHNLSAGDKKRQEKMIGGAVLIVIGSQQSVISSQ